MTKRRQEVKAEQQFAIPAALISVSTAPLSLPTVYPSHSPPPLRPISQSMLELLGETPVAAMSRAFPQPGEMYTPSETDAIMAHKFTEVS